MNNSLPTEQTHGEIFFVDHSVNLQKTISQFIAEKFSPQLPDLSQLVILVPAPDLIYTLRNTLLEELKQHKHNAFIGGEIYPLKKWVEQHIHLSRENVSFINNHCRQLIILQALQQYPAQFKDENLWMVAASLMQLFDELTTHHLHINELDEREWLKKIQQLYGVETDSEHLTGEARLIYTLWQAWKQQLKDDELVDQASAYIERLKAISDNAIEDKIFVIAGIGNFSANEIALIKTMAQKRPVYLFIQASPEDINSATHPDHFAAQLVSALDFKTTLPKQQTTSSFISQAFQYQKSLNQRYSDIDLPGTGSFKVFAANSEEQEAAAVDLQIRQWLLEGKRNLAIVTENRKLARRVRALLERSGVNLVDSVGWSLSTTSAASVVEKWLECIEQDFNAISFLDFLKSPFHFDHDDDRYLQNIFRFEQDIILHENISGHLQRYIKSLQLRQNRLQHWESECYQQITQLLDELENTAAPLVELFTHNKKRPASEYLLALNDSLKQLQLVDRLTEDEAGNLIIEEITHMLNACHVTEPQMNWSDFRTWFASALENHHYSPSTQASHVRLLNLKQSNSGYYQGLIIASADANQLPGPATRLPFFNNFVRHSLGLPDWQSHKAEHYYLFRRLVESADNVLTSYCREKANEEQRPSPWLQTIIDLYCIANHEETLETKLAEMLASGETSVLSSTHVTVPIQTHPPGPTIHEENIPSHFSSSRHQRLINCPYQFFANDILGLKATDELIDELQKSEYGQKVHYILERFHNENSTQSISFEQSLITLQQISKYVFKQEIEDNFLHRGWLKRWLDHCAAYLKWQQQRSLQWQFKSAELKQQTELVDNITLDGRIDRIDQQHGEIGIIDYKTSGKTPSQQDVDHGEDIQLSTYALLLDKVKQVEYLKLDEAYGKVSSGATLTENDLEEITGQTKSRLSKIIEQLRNSAPLVANGEDDYCRFCQFTGLCRQQYWKLET